MQKLIGISNFTSRGGKDCHTITILQDCTERDNSRGSFGQKAETIFLNDDLADKVKVADIGKNIVLDYEVSSGRAYIVGFTVK